MTRTGPVSAPEAAAGIRVLSCPSALRDLGPALDELQSATSCPTTARRTWQQTWLDCYGDEHEPLVVVVDSGGRLSAAALLAVSVHHGVSRVVPIGAGPSDEVRLPALDAQAAQLLAGGVARALGDLGRPWLLVARNLAPDDLGAAALHDELRWSQVTPGGPSPRLAFGSERTLRAHVSRNHHQQTRRMRNKLLRNGIPVDIAHLDTPEQMTAVWPELERICRARDLHLRGCTSLDDPCSRLFLRAVVHRLAAAGEVRLTTLRLHGDLVSYVLCFRDGPTRRMWNCRFDPAFVDFGVGRLANDAALADALQDPGCSGFDWMLGDEPYKSSMSNHVHTAVDLTAASNRALWMLPRVTESARERLRSSRRTDSPLATLVDAARPVLSRRGTR